MISLPTLTPKWWRHEVDVEKRRKYVICRPYLKAAWILVAAFWTPRSLRSGRSSAEGDFLWALLTLWPLNADWILTAASWTPLSLRSGNSSLLSSIGDFIRLRNVNPLKWAWSFVAALFSFLACRKAATFLRSLIPLKADWIFEAAKKLKQMLNVKFCTVGFWKWEKCKTFYKS